MRVILDITIAAVVILTVWSTNPTIARQHGTVSVDPASMTTTTSNYPEWKYDLF